MRQYPWGVAVLNGVVLPLGLVVIVVLHAAYGLF
jgi:hypothetical protein